MEHGICLGTSQRGRDVSSPALWATKIFAHFGANNVAQMSRQTCSHTPSALNAGAKRSGATCHMAMPQCFYGFRTFRQKHGGGRFGKTNMPERLRLKIFAETFRMICGAYPVYARSPSLSQRPAPTTITSRSPFPLDLCSCSLSLSKMGIYAAPRGRGALEEMRTYPRHALCFASFLQ